MNIKIEQIKKTPIGGCWNIQAEVAVGSPWGKFSILNHESQGPVNTLTFLPILTYFEPKVTPKESLHMHSQLCLFKNSLD